jgi:hypothetical protein
VRREMKAAYMPTMPAKVPKQSFSTALADGMLAGRERRTPKYYKWRELDRRNLYAADMHARVGCAFRQCVRLVDTYEQSNFKGTFDIIWTSHAPC